MYNFIRPPTQISDQKSIKPKIFHQKSINQKDFRERERERFNFKLPEFNLRTELLKVQLEAFLILISNVDLVIHPTDEAVRQISHFNLNNSILYLAARCIVYDFRS